MYIDRHSELVLKCNNLYDCIVLILQEVYILPETYFY